MCSRTEGNRRENSARTKLQDHRERIKVAAGDLQRREQLRLASLMPNIEELRALSPRDFESVIAQMFERMGFTVEQTPYVNDYGRDAILERDGKKFLLECKRYGPSTFVGRPDLQKFHSAIITDRAVSGFFVTAGVFTKDAIKFSKTVPIKLVDQVELLQLMFKSIPAATHDDTYCSMCQQCGKCVSHKLRTPRSIQCGSGHRFRRHLMLHQ